MRCAVVLTTYNAPRLLGICLRSLALQSDTDFDLLIADDGSTEETKAVIERFRYDFPEGRLQHFWHEDKGYRKSAINNEVFRAARGKYLYFILVDHDTIAHRDFVADHRRMQEAALAADEHLLFMGRRIDLGPRLSEELTEASVPDFHRGLSIPLLRSWLRRETRNIGRAIRITSPFLQKLLKRDRVADLLGSNFSIEASLLYAINGYDESFQSYWGEDGDLFVRARNSGATLRGLKGYAIQYHLHHERLDPTPEHEDRYRKRLADPEYRRCGRGIEQEGPSSSV